MRNIISRNPFTGQIKQQLSFFTEQALQRCFQRTVSAFTMHSKRSAKQKMAMIAQLIPQIDRQKVEISKLISFQTGKPIIQAQNQVKQALRVCDYYSKHSEALLSLNVKSSAKKKTLVKFLPTGTVLCILPFTNPFALTLYNTLPQILLGNCVFVKNTSTTPAIGKLIQNLMTKSGFQSGEYQNILVSHDQIDQVISRKQISGVNFTGSTQSGRKISQIAGKYLKMSTMQLSSNDSLIVMEDGNVDLAIENVMKLGYFNSGQGGSNPKRLIIHEKLHEQFKNKLINKANSLQYGNPFDRQTRVGPLSMPQFWERLSQQMKSIPSSFEIVYQRKNIEKPFFPITIIQSKSQVPDIEFIGPVFTLYKYKDNAQAIKMVNNSRYGNSHYIFSSKKGEQLAEHLKGGSIYFNQISTITSYIPKGGINLSGYGRQGGQEGIRRFANVKTVYIN